MKTVVICGASMTGKDVYKQICGRGDYKVLFFTDLNPKLIGTFIDGLEVKRREDILKSRPDLVIIGMLTGFDDEVNFLMQNGFSEEQIVLKYIDLPTRGRLASLEGIAKIFKKHGVDGDVAELGVYKGDFAKEINRIFPDRNLYLFDTFEGFPDEDFNYDKENNLFFTEVGRLANTSEGYVMSRMPHKEKIIIKKGRFPDTTVGLGNNRYAFVNIDVDLYKPILAGLEYFWPRMTPGGYIFVHDYFSLSYAGSQKAIEEFANKNGISFIPIGDTLSVAFCKPLEGVK